ncbi:MAG TPA: LysM peptidoglycan-binding domain-containing protein [Clostridiaceae bacterium]|nr:LysM peptidoglycan-binding domain-containing protein [Clostridiaceae bacterium]
MRIHVVRPGDSIYSISRMYGVSAQKIISDNELQNPDRLVVGQTIVILNGDMNYTVMPGDSLYSISRRFGVSMNAILSANPNITNPAQIYVGQVIIIPATNIKFGPIEVNGYAYPGTDREVLRKTLPYLTYLSIFSYSVREDGSLSTIPDQPLIDAARAAGTAPLMVITNTEEGAGFNSDIAHSVLTNATAQDNLVNNILTTLRNKNYYGLDIDFEYIYPYDRESYNNFLRRIVNTLRPLGYQITTALAPKISASQQGLLYEAHDYPVHGLLVDHVILMTYEWGYTYGPPMAVAPINEVRRVLEYAVTEIPNEKIFMGIPNYGYDWTLPFTPGTAAQVISNVGAVDLAARVGANIQYDAISQAPFFYYYDSNGRQHVVWFEDANSMLAKFTLANRFRVGGLSYWTIGRYFPQNWLVLSSVFDIVKVL